MCILDFCCEKQNQINMASYDQRPGIMLIVLILLKIEFRHTQISVLKTGITISKRVCNNPCFFAIYTFPTLLKVVEVTQIYSNKKRQVSSFHFSKTLYNTNRNCLPEVLRKITALATLGTSLKNSLGVVSLH